METKSQEKTLRQLAKSGGNQRCFVCNALGSQYIVPQYGIFVCTDCSGKHMACGHRVKSIAMGKFSADEVRMLEEGGNDAVAKRYLAKWKGEGDAARPVDKNPRKTEAWIRAVLIEKRYFSEVPAASVPGVNSNPAPELPRSVSSSGSSQQNSGHRTSANNIPVKPLSDVLGASGDSIRLQVSPRAEPAPPAAAPAASAPASVKPAFDPFGDPVPAAKADAFDPFGDSLVSISPAGPKPVGFDPFASFTAAPAAASAASAPAAAAASSFDPFAGDSAFQSAPTAAPASFPAPAALPAPPTTASPASTTAGQVATSAVNPSVHANGLDKPYPAHAAAATTKSDANGSDWGAFEAASNGNVGATNGQASAAATHAAAGAPASAGGSASFDPFGGDAAFPQPMAGTPAAAAAAGLAGPLASHTSLASHASVASAAGGPLASHASVTSAAGAPAGSVRGPSTPGSPSHKPPTPRAAAPAPPPAPRMELPSDLFSDVPAAPAGFGYPGMHPAAAPGSLPPRPPGMMHPHHPAMQGPGVPHAAPGFMPPPPGAHPQPSLAAPYGAQSGRWDMGGPGAPVHAGNQSFSGNHVLPQTAVASYGMQPAGAAPHMQPGMPPAMPPQQPNGFMQQGSQSFSSQQTFNQFTPSGPGSFNAPSGHLMSNQSGFGMMHMQQPGPGFHVQPGSFSAFAPQQPQPPQMGMPFGAQQPQHPGGFAPPAPSASPGPDGFGGFQSAAPAGDAFSGLVPDLHKALPHAGAPATSGNPFA